MCRRLIAVVGSLALMLTILPNVPGTEALDCCNGVMCPMHAPQVHAPNCDMDTHAPVLKPCPVQASVHFTASIAFVLVAPLVLNHDLAIEPASPFLPSFYSDVQRRVDSPPPRFLPTA